MAHIGSAISDEIASLSALSLSANQQLLGKQYAPGRGRGLARNDVSVPPPGLLHTSSTPAISYYGSYRDAESSSPAPMNNMQMRMNAPYSRPNVDYVGGSHVDGVDSRLATSQSSHMSSMSDHMSHGGSALLQTVQQENVGGTTYFYTEEELAVLCPNTVLPTFLMFPGALPHVAHLKPKPYMSAYFVENELKADIMTRQCLTLTQADPNQPTDIPAEVDNYRHLVLLETPPTSTPAPKSNVFGYVTSVYKAVNSKDGLTYCLKRLHGFRLSGMQVLSVTEAWKKLQHANIVNLREVFTTKAFGDNSIVFVYDYHPGCETLMTRLFLRASALNAAIPPFLPDGIQTSAFNMGSGGGVQPGKKLLPEPLLWSYIIQLSSAIRTVHASGLACRLIDPTKIIFTDKTRLRLNCLGILDVLNYDPTQTVSKTLLPVHQQEDLVNFGRLILVLASNSLIALQRDQFQASMDAISRNYSSDVKNLLLYLIQQTPARPRNINEIMPMIGARFYNQIETAMTVNDMLENELAKEAENGRLFRLVCKLGIINERPEHGMEPAWSESGDRYILKLFRDYLFYQTTDNGQPWIDMGHIVQCLNKVDAGVPEKICLTSRDEQSVLIVTYAELKRCFNTAFAELLQPPGESLQT